jgi:adenylate kinase
MRLVLVGPPGSGKGTQAQLLVQRLHLTAIGTGEILRDAVRRGTEMGKRVEPYMTQGLLVPDSEVNDVVAELFRSPNRPNCFVMDGYPRTYSQAIAFDALLKQQFLNLDAVIHFVVSDEEVIRRMCSRNRDDDKEETVRRRLNEYHKITDALIDYYRNQGLLRDVPATGTPEEIHQRVLQAIGAQ